MLFKSGGVSIDIVFCIKFYFKSFIEFYWAKKGMMNFFNFTYYLTTL